MIVTEVDSTEQRINDVVATSGERVLGPHEIPGMGIYAQVKDSEENVMGCGSPQVTMLKAMAHHHANGVWLMPMPLRGQSSVVNGSGARR